MSRGWSTKGEKLSAVKGEWISHFSVQGKKMRREITAGVEETERKSCNCYRTMKKALTTMNTRPCTWDSRGIKVEGGPCNAGEC